MKKNDMRLTLVLFCGSNTIFTQNTNDLSMLTNTNIYDWRQTVPLTCPSHRHHSINIKTTSKRMLYILINALK